MPLSGNFRREMLVALKNAKKNKETNEENDSAPDSIESTAEDPSVRPEPVSSNKQLKIEDNEVKMTERNSSNIIGPPRQ